MSEEQEQQAAPGTSVAEYSETEAGLAELRGRLQNIVHDVRSTEGNIAARADRKECVRLRGILEAKREELKAGVLARGRLIDGEAKRIRLAIEELEAPIDLQIKGEEQRKASEREERDRIERNRVAEIRAALDVIVRRPIDAIGLNVAALDKLIGSMVNNPPDPAIFQEFQEQAFGAHKMALEGVRQARDRKANEEAESARLKAERAQFEAEKQEEEERQRKARQEAEQRERAEREALEAEREQERARQVEARRLELERQRIEQEGRDRAFREAEEERRAAKELADAEAAAERAEADRIAREAREAADREAEAERQRKAEEARQAAAAEEARLAAQREEQERVAADLARQEAEREHQREAERFERERERREIAAKNAARVADIKDAVGEFVDTAEQYRAASDADALGLLVKLGELYINGCAAAVELGRSQGRAALEEEYRQMTHATLKTGLDYQQLEGVNLLPAGGPLVPLAPGSAEKPARKGRR